MATRIQFRRGTTSQHSTFTGAVGEMTVDTEKDTLIVHDGATAGGFELARADVSNVDNPQFGGTSSLLLPDGTTAQRPSGTNGQIRYNTSNNYVEGYQGGAWMPLGIVVASSVAEFGTQVTVAAGSTGVLVSGTHTKQYGTQTDVYLFANGYGTGHAGGQAGSYVEYGGTRSYEFFDYQYPSYAPSNIIIHGMAKFTGKSSGSQSYAMGWASNNGASTSPSSTWNSNAGTSDARARERGTNFIFLEVLA